MTNAERPPTSSVEADVDLATFALGGFWSAEVWFRGLAGVVDTRVGHLVGEGSLEVVEIAFDPAQVTYGELLDRFFGAHDPTMRPRKSLASDRLGSVIFTHGEAQAADARARLHAESAAHDEALRTEIRPSPRFVPADDEHQQRLAKRGAFTYQEPERTAAGYERIFGRPWLWPETLEPPERSPEDDALTAEFGALFSGHLGAGWFRTFLLGDGRQFDRVFDLLREWLPADSPLLDQPFPLTWADDVKPGPGPRRWWHQRGVIDLDLSIDAASATSTVLTTQAGAQLAVVVSHQPGDDLTRLDRLSKAHRVGGSGSGWHPRSFEAAPAALGPAAHDAAASRARAGTWYEHIPSSAFLVDCGGGARHHCRWQDGELRLSSDDEVEMRERSLVALGSSPCWCFRIAAAWNPLWVSTRLSKHLLDQLMAEQLGEPIGRPRFSPPGGSMSSLDMSGIDPTQFQGQLPDPAGITNQSVPARQSTVFWQVFVLISRLPAEFQVRWLLGGLASLEARQSELSRADRALLEGGVFAAMRGALKASLWQWCRADPAVACGAFDLRYLDRGEGEATACGRVDGETAHVSVAVPFDWLTHVWARGLAAIDDSLVLMVDGPADAAELDVVVAGWEESGPDGATDLVTRRTSLCWDGRAWRLAASP